MPSRNKIYPNDGHPSLLTMPGACRQDVCTVMAKRIVSNTRLIRVKNHEVCETPEFVEIEMNPHTFH